MWRARVTNLTNTHILNTIQDKKIILLYPQVTHRTLFLSTFLNTVDGLLLYCRVPDTITIVDLTGYLLEQCAETLPDFGSQLRAALDQNSDVRTMAKALAHDLGATDEQIMVYLDDFDRIIWDEGSRIFFAELAATLPDNAQVAISGRKLTTNPWQQMVLDGVAVVLGTAFRANQLMFDTSDVSKPQLEINAFGRGQAIVDGEPIESWDGALPRNLFFYFIDNELITRDQIFEVFWPDLDVKEATNVFHVTKRKITERVSLNVLGGGNYEITAYSSGFYVPSDKVVRHYDVAEFEDAIEEAGLEFDDTKAAALYRRAIEIYKAPFLLSIDMPWVYERREKLRLLFVEALIGLARIHRSAGEAGEALGYFLRTLREMPEREDIHREVMMIYEELGRHDEALQQYEFLRMYLKEHLSVAPGPETRAMYEKIAG